VIYGRQLTNRTAKEQLFTDLSLAISDVIYQCERLKGSNLDNNLVSIIYNTANIEAVLAANPIQKIYFSSRFVENKYKTKFKHLLQQYSHIQLITLPSPSPRYAAMSLRDKIKKYTQLLPHL